MAVAPSPPDQTTLAWLALRDGHVAKAEQAFTAVLAEHPGDVRALFAVSNLAYEHGDDEVAAQRSLTLLEAAAQGGDGWAAALATATLSRMSRLLAELPNRRPTEDRLIALDGARLPWQARYTLALVLIDIARKRGDRALLAKATADAGCVPVAKLAGRGGRLPYLDFDDDAFTAEQEPRPLVRAGCQLQLSTPDSRGGIRVVRSTVELPPGHYTVVLDFDGPARLRVDGGPWHAHGGTAESYGVRWSAASVDLGGRRHTLEARLGGYGSSTDLALLVMPAVTPPPLRAEEGQETEAANALILTFAKALEANLVGDTDRLLTQIDMLAAESKFALGLSAAARLGQADPTRPADIMRDKGRELFAHALTLDGRMARVWLDLANLENQKSRPREAATDARHALEVAPSWWPAHLGLSTALRAQGFEEPADAELDAAMKLLDLGKGGCSLIEQALDRAEERDKESRAAYLVDLLTRCDAQNDAPRAWLQKHGDLAGVKAWLDQSLPLSSEPLWLRSERADTLLALGDLTGALEGLDALSRLAPRETGVRIRLADAMVASGAPERARAALAETLTKLPGHQDVRQAARLVGLPLPLDAYRLDGKSVIRDYLASGRSYQAPAVVVLDRAVEKALPDGGRILLTHSITQVLSKDAIEHVGEVPVPEGAEILALRTHKADGSVREAEEIPGKATISVPNLAVGDFVESETLEFKDARDALAPGFVGERFYFQSFDAPLDRSEYLFIAPPGVAIELSSRSGAPQPVESRAKDGSRVLTFSAKAVPQVFAERQAVPAQEWIPSVRVSSRLSVQAWSRFIADGFLRTSRGSPQIRALAAHLANRVGGERGRLPQAIAAWVDGHIEPENDFAESATATLARGRGNRAALLVALARSLDVPADLVLVRSLLAARADAPIRADELDDFADVLVRFPGPAGDRFVDPQLRRAPFGYVPPALSGATAIVAGQARPIAVASAVKDARQVSLQAELQDDGGARVSVVETLSGWPAVEWSELIDVAGKDRERLRQEFEQRWLGQHFPGAQLDTLAVDADALGARIAYTFKLAGMATRSGGLLVLRPAFFQSQPGRRFGSEPERRTGLMLGFDIPVDLQADILLPPGAKVLDPGQDSDVEIGGARFVEKRSVSTLPSGRIQLSLRRQSRLPLMRIDPGSYAGVAAKLRAVDPIEQGEVRIAVAGN